MIQTKGGEWVDSFVRVYVYDHHHIGIRVGDGNRRLSFRGIGILLLPSLAVCS